MFQNNKKQKLITTSILVVINFIFLICFLGILIKGKHAICLFKLIFHVECPGCGMTRAFYNFLIFNFKEGIKYNNKIIIVYPLIWGIYINYIYKNKYLFKGEKYGNKKNK